MNREKIQKNFKKKLQLINKYNNFYFDKSKPIVSDKEYDDLKREITLLENKYEFLN